THLAWPGKGWEEDFRLGSPRPVADTQRRSELSADPLCVMAKPVFVHAQHVPILYDGAPVNDDGVDVGRVAGGDQPLDGVGHGSDAWRAGDVDEHDIGASSGSETT